MIEIGFQSIAAGHYKHAAMALALDYVWVGLEVDVHAMASATVHLKKKNMKRILRKVDARMGTGKNVGEEGTASTTEL